MLGPQPLLQAAQVAALAPDSAGTAQCWVGEWVGLFPLNSPCGTWQMESSPAGSGQAKPHLPDYHTELGRWDCFCPVFLAAPAVARAGAATCASHQQRQGPKHRLPRACCMVPLTVPLVPFACRLDKINLQAGSGLWTIFPSYPPPHNIAPLAYTTEG